MLRILPYNSVTFDKGIVIGDAYDVRVTYEINGERRLDFSHPINEKSEIISENKIVVCEGQAYRIIKVLKTIGEKNFIAAECSHVYNADASNIHIQNIPDLIGKTPSYVLGQIFKNTKFSIMTDSELTKVGLKRVDYSGFKVDFFSMDKTNPYEAVKALIENCGKGEIYADNYKIALVERIGGESCLRLDLSKNMKDISIERDITDMVTKLYPYGKDDAHIGSVNSGKQYIISENADIYGVREGYRDYTDYIEPSKILRRARWEFDRFPALPSWYSSALHLHPPYCRRYGSCALPFQKGERKHFLTLRGWSCPFPGPYAGPDSLHLHFLPIPLCLHQALVFR